MVKGEQRDHCIGYADVIVCIALSLAFSASGDYITDGYCQISLAFFLTAAGYCAVFLLVTAIIRSVHMTNPFFDGVLPASILKITEGALEKKHTVLLMAMIMFALWLPVITMLYPGTLINDTWRELQSFIDYCNGDGVLKDHHPVFDTVLMGILIVPLSKASGEWHVVIYIYVLVQSFITCLSFSYAVEYSYSRLKIGKTFALGMFLCFCLMPIYPASVQTVCKDSLFAWIFVFFFVHYIEVIRTNGTALRDWRYLVNLTLLAVLCVLTKKVGIYVIALSLLTVVVFLKGNRKRMMVPLLAVCVLMMGIMPVVKEQMNIENGSKLEMMSIPIQQTARYVTYHKDDITEEEYQIIDRVLRMEDLEKRYDPISADPVKSGAYRQQESGKSTKEDYRKYIFVWVKQGMRHPGSYIAALCAMDAGWFSWEEYKPLMNMSWHPAHDVRLIPSWVSERQGLSAITGSAYEKAFDKMYDNPILRLFLTYGLYAALIPAYAAVTTIRYRKDGRIKYWIVLIPILLSIVLGCWLSPLSIYFEGRRYLYPITYTAPILLAWCAFIYQKRACEDNKDG